jgi:hypothetical protein
MRDWPEVRASLASDLVVEVLAGGNIHLTVGDQPVLLEAGRAFDEPWITAVAPVVFADQVERPRDALELNAILAIGALAIVDGMLTMRWAWPLAPLDAATLDRYIRFVAREATRLRAIHARVASAHSAVDFLGE